jgi:hypothetical protein
MVNSDWLGNDKDVLNPYYGKDMLTCGELTGAIMPRGIIENENYVVGYYCPIFPDRLFEKPSDCPIDKFPMKKVRVEKVLAIPDSSVIDTGTRKIVYKQSGQGVFDMIEVALGKRAGNYYPVLSGLKKADQIVTAGTFLIDAENRLNPSASVQYFGASGK